MDVVLLLMVLGVMLSGFWAADALDHIRKEIFYSFDLFIQEVISIKRIFSSFAKRY